MKKSDIFFQIAGKVSEICQVNLDDMMRSELREQKLVDARTLTVQYAIRVGFTSSEIADIVLQYLDTPITPKSHGSKARMVSNVYRSYMDRCLQNPLFCILSKEVKVWVKETYGVGMDV